MPRGGMTPTRTLREPLERLYREFDYGARVGRDALQFPLRLADPRDREIVARLPACLAYGRVDLFGRELDGALRAMGASPFRFVIDFELARDARAFDGFRYRFNRPPDLVAFCVAAREILLRYGSLEKCFTAGGPHRGGPVGPPPQRVARAVFVAGLPP